MGVKLNLFSDANFTLKGHIGKKEKYKTVADFLKMLFDTQRKDTVQLSDRIKVHDRKLQELEQALDDLNKRSTSLYEINRDNINETDAKINIHLIAYQDWRKDFASEWASL